MYAQKCAQAFLYPLLSEVSNSRQNLIKLPSAEISWKIFQRCMYVCVLTAFDGLISIMMKMWFHADW
jgi:hypothetical protein